MLCGARSPLFGAADTRIVNTRAKRNCLILLTGYYVIPTLFPSCRDFPMPSRRAEGRPTILISRPISYDGAATRPDAYLQHNAHRRWPL